MSGTPKESKALRLARYLKEFVGLRSTSVRDVDKYEAVVWFCDVPQEPECQSPAWNDSYEPGDAWLEVRKQQFPKAPDPPEIIHLWIDRQALKQATAEMPQLRETILLPVPASEDGEEWPPVEHKLADHSEVARGYERYRPNWEAWSAEYRRRDRIQAVYAELFRMHTQLRKQGEIVELVVGLGLLDWRSTVSGGKTIAIRRHVVAARVDLHFDPTSGIIRLEAAADGSQLRIEDDMLEADLRPERSFYASVHEQLDAIGDDVWDQATMHAALKSWAGALHADSQWSGSLKPTMDNDGRPAVTFAPALILRRRTQLGMVRVYDALIEQLKADDSEVPAGWSSLIEDADDGDEDPSSSALDSSDNASDLGLSEIYFPLAANREQRRIVEAIDKRRGVLVQGPPGTGKSHTIANLVCHLLATGKRVLITAETGRALQVLKDKLPKEIRPLCVSLLGQGGDAFSELNAAVQGITTRHTSYTPGAYDDRIAEIDHELDFARRALAKLDTELRSLREEETCPHSVANGAYQGSASAIADRVASERGRFDWLQLPRDAADYPPVSHAELATWLRVCRTYDDGAIADSKLRLVPSEKLPAPAAFGIAVATERETKAAVERLDAVRRYPAYGPILAHGPKNRSKLAEYLRVHEAKRHRIDRFTSKWVSEAVADVLEGRLAVWHALRDRSRELIDLVESMRESLGAAAVSIQVDKDIRTIRADAKAIVQHLEAGGKWKYWGIFTPKAIRERTYLSKQVIVDGHPAKTLEGLRTVCTYLDLLLALENLDQAWSDHGGLPSPSALDMRLPAIKEHIGILHDALQYGQDCMKLGAAMKSASPAIPEPDWRAGQAQEWLTIIEATGVEERYQKAVTQSTICLRDLKVVCDLFNAHPVAHALMEAVQRRDVTAYSQAHAQLLSIEQTHLDQQHRQQIETMLRINVPGLIEAVAANLDDRAWDDRFDHWKGAWHWGVVDNWLQKRTDQAYQQKLWQSRHETEKAIGRLLAESAALRAWRYFFARLSQKESAALKGWRQVIQNMPKDKNSAKRARLLRDAREYMNQCREAIPVWIMPRYLVAEMVDLAPCRYDIVIVDEASQLGIESLFLFYIAKKMVVVGDDQQISPAGVGIADAAIDSLQHLYLENIPHKGALSAQSSVYGNAKIRFGQNIVLREHFRCMPEIIQFSNDLCYANNGTPLDPLRTYPANRLQPLVLRRVPDGYRTGSSQNALNEPEADALLAQIIACIDDPRYKDLSMGVISLQGESQAKLIEHKLLEKLEPKTIVERRLICGDAYAFQGDERNIIFLSMVAAPGEVRIGALTDEAARRRFNVAASRAQDQLWLFHSADLDVLSNACMRHRLLSYMLNPGRRVSEANEQRFESQFERDVWQQISAKGFHVRTQVCVGDATNHRYRIDLVVEGMQGRLAVECDGDQWHGPDQYEKDMARQRDLERAGWQFVRIRGGEFYRNRATALESLWAELDRLGIEPRGVDEGVAEPPAPADFRRMERTEVDEIISSEPSVVSAEESSLLAPAASRTDEQEVVGQSEILLPLPPFRDQNSLLATYAAYSGPACDDPRIVNAGAVAEGLCRIIEVEGPVLAKRAYDIYLRSCGIKRMGHELKSSMNKALANAIRQGRVVSEDEIRKGGLIYSVVRTTGSHPIKLRHRGPRTFEEIPPSELLAVATYLTVQQKCTPGSDDHLREILEYFDLKRLTTQVGTTLLEILKMRFPYVDDFLSDIGA